MSHPLREPAVPAEHGADAAARPAATPPRADREPSVQGLRMRVELDAPSDVRYIERIVAAVQRECATFAFPARHCALNVPVALSEAISNAILRGNRDRPGALVRVRACIDDHELVVEVEDEGEGFDFEACLNDPADPGNLEREDGRGLFLMRALMDRVEQFRRRGNVVRLTLRRP
jgi:serine/threonine-protein kinase RsbW